MIVVGGMKCHKDHVRYVSKQEGETLVRGLVLRFRRLVLRKISMFNGPFWGLSGKFGGLKGRGLEGEFAEVCGGGEEE